MMRRLVLGTAGHIDHGKTTLVRALTGVDTDRLPEEKRRGITIDLGFASLALSDEISLGIVDVPGHEAFIRNMLAGATGIDLFLLVIAADEGVMPQTREHVDILKLLGIRRGVVALTKSDLVESDWMELVHQDAVALLADAGIEGMPVLGVSARTGSGIPELIEALRTCAHIVEPGREGDLFRMPIDRVFTVRGTGTVVTGTVWSGSLRRDQQVHLVPGDLTARVRSLQQHGAACDEVSAGARAAIALTGIDRESVGRGDTAVAATWSSTGILTAQLHVLADAPGPVRPRQRVRVHLGTAEVLGRIGLLREPLAPGETAIVQLRLEEQLLARAGDRVVVRSYSPVHTIAGGVCLEPAAPKRKRLDTGIAAALDTLSRELNRDAAQSRNHDAAQSRNLDSAQSHNHDAAQSREPDGRAILRAVEVLGPPQGVDPSLLPVLTGLTPAETEAAIRAEPALTFANGRIVSAERLNATGEEVLRRVSAAHGAEPLADGLERERLRHDIADPLLEPAVEALIARGAIAVVGNAFALPGHTPEPDDHARSAIHALEQIYRVAGLQAPDLTELPAQLRDRPDILQLHRYMERRGTLDRVTSARWMHSTALAECVAALRSQLPARTPLTVGELKEVLKLTRKHLMPLLEYLDRSGVTRRNGEVRVLETGGGVG